MKNELVGETPRVSRSCTMQLPSQEEAGCSEELESPNGKEDVLVSPQWPGVQGSLCTRHSGRVGAGAVWDRGVVWDTAVGTAVCKPLCWGP